MKKQICSMITALACLTLLAVPVCAQSSQMIGRAHIPFDFVIRDTTFPSGQYVIERIMQGGQVLLLRGADGPGMMFAMLRVQSGRPQEQGQLVFQRYGEQHFLSQVWASGESTGWRLNKGRRERALLSEMERQALAHQRIPVALSR